MCGHLDGDRYDINQVIADHREWIGKPAISAEGFSGLPCTLLVARCHSRELQAGKTVDRRNVRHLRPACFGIRTDDSDSKFFLGHGCPPYSKVIAPLPAPLKPPRLDEVVVCFRCSR